MHGRDALLLAALSFSLAACQGALAPSTGALADAAPEPEAGTVNATDAGTPAFSGDAAALTSLPIGDGKYLVYPQQGYIFGCTQSFGGGGGAAIDGPWIHADAGTFDLTAKIAVQGSVNWPAHVFAATLSGSTRTVTGNALPDHPTGQFPIASTDPAYAYDRNPNSIKAQTLSWTLPATPTVAATPTCLGGGPIGVLMTGSVFFDALDGEGRDAVAHELQDACEGHPEPTGEYHYHSVTSCLADPGTGHSALLGYARDGFGVYGVRGENGQVLTNADLDECHGHTHAISWDGQTVTLYHYHATYEYPYTLGCYRGTPGGG